ncbi:hypothetical protein BDR26DRAFT_862082 [Obelidium mucronatum]|nr:hypothetical protein BDR26DRAFT_862082 [Obelidium mucronatum]
MGDNTNLFTAESESSLSSQWQQDAFDVNAMFDLFEQQNARSAVFSTAALGRYTSQPYQQLMPSSIATLQPTVANLEFQKQAQNQTATRLLETSKTTTTTSRRGSQARHSPYTIPIQHRTISNPITEFVGGSTGGFPFMGSNFGSTYAASDSSAFHLQTKPICDNIDTNNTLSNASLLEETNAKVLLPSSSSSTFSIPDENPSNNSDNEGEKEDRGRRVHREAEKQRRESLRTGFERLKDLLPPLVVGTDKIWSQAKLLESGLDYIEQLKEELVKKERENRKLKEAVRRIVAAHNESVEGGQ